MSAASSTVTRTAAREKVLARCRKIDPDEIQYDLKSGRIHLSRESWIEAARDFGEVLKRQPDHPEALQGFLKAQSRIP